MKVYQYPKCSTCRNALKWLDTHKVGYDKVDITLTPPSRAELQRLYKKSGLPLKKFFNTSGNSYKDGDFKTKLESWSEDKLLDALAKDGKLIKRPLIDTGKVVLVGFDAKAYADAF